MLSWLLRRSPLGQSFLFFRRASFCCRFLLKVALKTRVCRCEDDFLGFAGGCFLASIFSLFRFALIRTSVSPFVASSSSDSSLDCPSCASMRLRICSTSLKCPCSSTRSASSRTKNRTFRSFSTHPWPSLTISHNRPGVATITSTPLLSRRCCFCTDKPPVIGVILSSV